MANTSTTVGVEFKKFDGNGFDLWRWKAHFTYKDVQKHWRKTNQLLWMMQLRNYSIIRQLPIYMVVSDEVLGNIKGLTSGH